MSGIVCCRAKVRGGVVAHAVRRRGRGACTIRSHIKIGCDIVKCNTIKKGIREKMDKEGCSDNLINYIEFIKTLREIEIESIYNNDNIIYGSKKYIKTLDKNFVDPIIIENNILKNKVNPHYEQIFKSLSKN